MSFRPRLTEEVRSGLPLVLDPGAETQGLVVAFSSRLGGISSSPFSSLNLSGTVGDDPAAVAENRARLCAALGYSDDDLVLARQVHGCDAIEVGAGAKRVAGQADVIVTATPGVLAGVLTADCTPVVIAGDRAVAVIHAGWRGLAAGAIETGLERVGRPWAAWIGPSIHACCYEVGPEVVDAFRARGLPVFDEDHVDPGRAAHAVLRRAGVGCIAMDDSCTACDARYFSHRRDGKTGRQGGFVALRDAPGHADR